MIREKHLFATLAVATALCVPGIVFAQAPPKPNPPSAPQAAQADATACAPSDTPSTVGKGAPVDTRKSADTNLSDKLAKSNGVICPPENADHEIKAPTPPGGSMPVIPPPGSPGGDQSVQPK